MLIRFQVSNFRSIGLDPVELSMVAIDSDRPAARRQEALGVSLLPIAGVYGPNASGKSNILASIEWLAEAVNLSLRFWDERIPVEPFVFNAKEKDTTFEIEMVVDGVRFEYLLEVSGERVSYEALFHYPHKKRRKIFEREGLNLSLQRGVGSISGTRGLLTERTMALAAARRFDEPLVSRFARSLVRIRSFGQRGAGSNFRVYRGRMVNMRQTMTLFEGNSQPSLFEDLDHDVQPDLVNGRAKALAMLRLADLGIDEVVIADEEVIMGPDNEKYKSKIVRLVHKSNEGAVPFDFKNESDGTQMWFRLIGPVIKALDSGSLVIFDELDASLHPVLSAELLSLFRNPATNPLGAQLVFSSHDTSLLNHLNRDEVWLTKKRGDGSTCLGALSEFAGERVRRSRNLESAYLHGRFDALPEIDQSEFLRSLGLIG